MIFINLLIVCSSHVIDKRSLLGGSQSHGHQGQHGHHQRQQHSARNSFGQRAGRDDDQENEIR